MNLAKIKLNQFYKENIQLDYSDIPVCNQLLFFFASFDSHFLAHVNSGHGTKGLALLTVLTFDTIKKEKKLKNKHLSVNKLKDPSFPAITEDCTLQIHI